MPRLSDLIEKSPLQKAAEERGKKATKEGRAALKGAVKSMAPASEIDEDGDGATLKQSPEQTAPDSPSNAACVAFAERLSELLEVYPPLGDAKYKSVLENVLQQFTADHVSRMPTTKSAAMLLADYRERYPEEPDDEA